MLRPRSQASDCASIGAKLQLQLPRVCARVHARQRQAMNCLLSRLKVVALCERVVEEMGMQRREKALLARDAKRNIGVELLQAIREVKAGKGRMIGAKELARVRARSSKR